MSKKHIQPNAQDLMIQAMNNQQTWFKSLFSDPQKGRNRPEKATAERYLLHSGHLLYGPKHIPGRALDALPVCFIECSSLYADD
jgi:hypothetical protein